LTSGQGDDIPTVEVQRRRKPTTPPSQRERADAPSRERPPSSGGYPPSGGGFSSGGGGVRPPTGGGMPIPGGSAGMGCLGLVALLVIGGLVLLFGGGGGNDAGQLLQQEAPSAVFGEQAQQVFPEVEEPVFQAPEANPTITLNLQGGEGSGTAGGDTWTVMLYQDADDRVLEQDIFVDFNEAERVGSTDNVKIVSQLDRYRGGYSADGDWTGTRRFLAQRDDDLGRIRSPQADLGEANMSDADTLVDFVTWAMKEYPADKYALILSDHGMGWPGGWSDPTSNEGGQQGVPLASRLGDQLYLNELDVALGEIRRQTGLDKFELVGMDACLMGHLEVFTALEPHARYAVASQETEPALGWAYTSFLGDLVANPAMSGAELGRYIVKSYIAEDQRITDDSARAEFAGGGRAYGVPSAQAMTAQLEHGVTLSAVDLARIPVVNQAFNDLAYKLQQADQRGVAQARSYSQSFTSIFGSDAPPSYIDLANFAGLVKQVSSSAEVNAAADQLLGSMQTAVLAEKSGSGKPGAAGISIYFPNSQLYRNPVAGPPSYLPLAERFAQTSLWDDFLAYHYTGRQFQLSDAAAIQPEQLDSSRAPAAGSISVSDLTLSSKTVAPGQTVEISAVIEGENVGYVKLMVGFVDRAANSVMLIDADYLESAESQEVDGVYYPVWPDGKFRVAFAWDPVVFAVDDGANTGVALFKPELYGRTFEDAIYSVTGTYKFADGSSPVSAKLSFRNGVLAQVVGFTGDGETGAPREIVPVKGDAFTITEEWMDLNAQGSVMQTAAEDGETLTFSGETWTWQDLTAAAGDYVIGFIVEDLDGNEYPIYDQITVVE
jgi:hypothetical protein